MQDKIDAYRKKNHYLVVLKETVKPMDGRAFNRRFDSCLSKVGISHHDNKYVHVFKIPEMPNNLVYGGNMILEIDRTTWSHVVEDNRIVADKFIEYIDKQLHNNTNEIALMEQNEKNKDKLISEYNNLAIALSTLVKSMSVEFRDKYKHNFNNIYEIMR